MVQDGAPSLNPILECRCRICVTWRRIGTVLVIGHDSPGFHQGALDILREAFSEILDHQGGNFLGPSAPVAVGVGGPRAEAEKRQEEVPKTEEEKSRTRSRRKRRGEPTSPERKRSEGSSRRTRAPAEDKTAAPALEPPSSKVKCEEEDDPHRGPVASPISERSVKKEKSKKSKRKSRSRSPVASPGEDPTSRGSRGERDRGGVSDEGEKPPGTWVLKPRSPSHPPPHRRHPPEPDHPPSWWRDSSRERQKERSKGIKKKERNQDIYEHGCSDTRKKEREERQQKRPAAAVEAVEVPSPGGVGEGAVEKFKRGEEIKPFDVPAGEFGKGDWVVVTKGVYGQQEAQVAGRVLREELESGERELRVEVTGTSSEALLRYATALANPVVRLHLCGDGCNQQRENPDLVHAQKLRLLRGGEAKTWEVNLIEEPETRALREEQEAWRAAEDAKKKAEEEAQKKKEAASSSSSGGKKKKKKKKKKKRKAEGDPSPAVKKQKMGGKTVAKKNLESVFQGTGMDPCPRNRRRLVKKIKKALKKGSTTSPSGSSSTSSTGSSHEDSNMVLQDRSRVHRVAALAPGLLTSSSLETMKGYLTQVGGSGWEEDKKTLPPLLSRIPGPEVERWSGPGVRNVELCGGFDGPGPHSGGPGRHSPENEVDRDDFKWYPMEYQPEAGAHSAARGGHEQQARTPSGAEGDEARLRSSTRWTRRRERERQRKREDQRQRKGERQGQSKAQRGGQDGLKRRRIEEPGRDLERQMEETLPSVGDHQRLPKGREENQSCGEERKKVKGLEASNELQPPKERCPGDPNAAKTLEEELEDLQVGSEERPEDQTDQRRLEDGKDFNSGTMGQGDGSNNAPAFRTDPETAATVLGNFFEQEGNPSVKDLGHNSGLGRVVMEKEAESGSRVSLGGIMGWLESRMDGFVSRLCSTLPSGRVFPLPTSMTLLCHLFPNDTPSTLTLLRCLVLSLNSLNGEGTEGPEKASEFQVSVLAGLVFDCARVSSWVSEEEAPTWERFFKVRGIDYKGDEILTAQSMRWENVRSALPQEVGTVPLVDVVELGCLRYVKQFEDYLLDPADQVAVKAPRVLVPPDGWDSFCSNLLERGVFDKVHESELYEVNGRPLLNGLFGVSKQEFDGPWEVQRIIMNLIPLNQVCRSFDGDVATLPSWAGMTPLTLEPTEELVVSSEDIRCFFYIFKVPLSWHRFLAFNRPLPQRLAGDKPGRWYPCSAVLPMGFRNSVSLAQHVHRVILRKSLRVVSLQGSEAELRKDKGFTTSNPMHRIYLDNFDELEKVSSEVADTIRGKVSPLVQGLQETYGSLGVPRHPKKAVARQSKAEVQGALLDGKLGIAYPKVEKVLKYAYLAQLLLQQDTCIQKQMQVVGGGFVYIAMFRRPLLGALNHIWQFILSFEGHPPVVRLFIPTDVKRELARFLGLLPLVYMDFRCDISPVVTASDASETGGGVTMSSSLSPAGIVASHCAVRGDVVDPVDVSSVLTIGIFDGIAALRVAADALGWNVQGHVSIEKSADASRVVESRFPQTIRVKDVALVDRSMVQSWADKFTQVSVVMIGAGPPCQGVSGLNAARKGALKDARSSLFVHVPRIVQLVKECFPWAQVRSLMESVASMDVGDQDVMSEAYGDEPWLLDSGCLGLCHRPRLYWLDWELLPSSDFSQGETPIGRRSIKLNHDVDMHPFLTPGWTKSTPGAFPTFTTSRPRQSPGYKPAGLKQCSQDAIERWTNDLYRFPPYQYQKSHCLQNKKGTLRVPDIREREVLMGFPRDYTANCLPKGQQKGNHYVDTRLTLIGNSWNTMVVAWLLSKLGHLLGLNEALSIAEIVSRTSPGSTLNFQTYLQRPTMTAKRHKVVAGQERQLVKKFLSTISMKGEDILLQASTEDQTRYHRLRSRIPAHLWRWHTAASWQWSSKGEHINALELRAVLTSLRWRLERHKKLHTKFVHMIDSLVALHTLSRGRSSSRKLRGTILRVNALLLATRSQAVWAYVHTKQNPADAPSRRPQKRKWTRCQKGI
eukprot:Skav215704  [mRNA]  locus=scaffold2573:57842:63963:+ [translate_table: standard]